MSALSSNPVRVYGYTVVVALLGLMVFLNLVDAGTAAIIAATAAAVLAVPATELVRSKVTPVNKKP